MSKHKYAHTLAFHDNTMYVGIGGEAELIAYNLKTRKKENILPKKYKNYSFVYHLEKFGDKLFVFLYHSFDVLVYDLKTKEFILEKVSVDKEKGVFPTFNSNKIHFSGIRGYMFEYDKLQNTLHRLIPKNQLSIGSSRLVKNQFIEGVNRDAQYVNIDLSGKIIKKIDLTSAGLPPLEAEIMSMSAHNGIVYLGERVMRKLDTRTNEDTYSSITDESKSTCILGKNIISANYPKAKIYKYPMKLEKNSNYDDAKYLILDIKKEQNRPRKIVCDEKTSTVLIGTQPEYGKYGGALSYYNIKTKKSYTVRDIVKNHTIEEVALDNEGYSYLGTSVLGGTGTNALDEDAKLVKWNISKKKKEYEVTPEKNNKRITSIIALDSQLFITTANSNLFLLDKTTGEKINNGTKKLNRIIKVNNNVYGSYKGELYKISTKDLSYTRLDDGQFERIRHLTADISKGNIFFTDNKFDLRKYTP